MALSNYTEIKAGLLDWLNRTGFQAITDRADDFLAFGQRRIERTIRVREMETVDSIVTSSLTFTIPSDYLETKDMTIIGGNSNTIVRRRDFSSVRSFTNPGRPRYFADAGGNFYLGPPPNQEYTIEHVYYGKETPISSTVATNFFSLNAPELILFSSLVAAANFSKDEGRAKIWEKEYQTAAALLDRQEAASAHSGTDLSVKESVLIETGFTP